ncbi:hypothetical protein EKE94_05155 [Mesobaculum littorinae]|uniref:3-oxoacyl-[acyl-carrier-protein] synthase-3 n=1 Tax=Mesobaculum littorinae TaxID=2486419 RepID=A0A438AHX4_9RHOB|nr:hypothetical protein [Mesobaculum littorinae]RVV98319.1 hypothetical protein EKE94_05155 [Mesobaculum littorinae]
MALYVTAAGLASVLAPTLAGTRAALREGRTMLRRQRGFLGPDWAPLTTALAGEPDPAGPVTRMTALACQALDDLAAAAPDLPQEDVAIAVLLPEPRDGIDADMAQKLGDALVAEAAQRLGVRFVQPTLHLDAGCALAAALSARADEVEAGQTLLVLAVDSHAARDRLNALNNARRLFSKATPYGAIPGEGAVALVVTARPDGARARIEGLGIDVEEVGEFDLGDSDYAAITASCWDALPDDGRMVDVWVTDWNNSRYRAAELSYLRVRLGSVLAPGCAPAHQALDTGDIGAAGPAFAVALALGTPGLMLVTAGSPGSNLRAAIALTLFEV